MGKYDLETGERLIYGEPETPSQESQSKMDLGDWAGGPGCLLDSWVAFEAIGWIIAAVAAAATGLFKKLFPFL